MDFNKFMMEMTKKLAIELDIPIELLEKEYEKDKKRNKKLIVNERLREKA